MGKVNGKSLRIDEMFAFIAVDDEDDSEGIISVQTDSGHMPLVGADMARVESLRPWAADAAKAAGIDIRLVKFSVREDIATYKDGGWDDQP